MATPRLYPNAAQQALLEEVKVRLVENEEELRRWQEMVEAHHYLRDACLVGACLRYVAQSAEGQWLALLGWSSPARHLRGREAWLGWSQEQRERRLRLVAQNSRFLIVPGVECPNLASRVLSLCLERLSEDWEQVHGHGVLLAETFVDPERFLGTCYRAAGWQALGRTQGYARAARDYYVAHDRPKELWVRELRRGAAGLLRGVALPESLRHWEAEPVPRNALGTPQMKTLLEVFQSLQDPRRAQGRKHRAGSVLACAAVGVLAGARTYADMATVASHLSQPQLRALRCYRNSRTARHEPPSESTFWRVLSKVEAEALDSRLGQWLARQPGARDQPLALDGKTVRGAKIALFAAFTHSAQSVVAQVRVPEKTQEMHAVVALLAPLEVAQRVVTADALHTQSATARHLVQDRGADYLLVVKDNQPTLRQQCERLLPEPAFSP
jgi:hypothetical protein